MKSARPVNLLLVFAALGIVTAAAWAAGELGRRQAADDLARSAVATRDLDLALLESELQRHRAIPVILAGEAPLARLLASGREADRTPVNARLEAIARQTGAADIYLLDREGRAVAASNYRTDRSFVGGDYAFRPYYRDALARGGAEFFGLGTVSRQPGLYISRRIDDAGRPVGVVVVKVTFQAVETAWSRQPGEVVVADDRGVILLTSHAERRFTTLTPLPEVERRTLAATRQFGQATLDWSGVEVGPSLVRIEGRDLSRLTASVPATPWRLELWTPRTAERLAVSQGRWIGAIVATAILAGLGLLWRRHRRTARRAHDDAVARQALETRVADRTSELSQANDRLSSEMQDRERAERRLRGLQRELVQANRAAQLGQTMAGVAHEINQPVAAIRAHADNARTLLDRGRADQAAISLGRIQTLTGRIADTIESLRAMARKGPRVVGPVPLAEVVEGSLLLLASRDRVGVEVRSDLTPLTVLGERVRLEQILINLLQNAFEATETTTRASVILTAARRADWVDIHVEDNGPGVSRAVLDSLFTPFSTAKPGGLGLGLVISREIAEGFGGTLTHAPSDLGGARFTLTLRAAA